MYQINSRTLEIAKRNGLVVKPSTKSNKKIDVYKNGVLLHSIGAIGYGDYPHYLKKDGKEIADKMRQRYVARHKKGIDAGYLGEELALKLLWS